MRVAISGATGLIGSRIVRALRARGDAVTVLSRDPDKARARLGDVDARAWRPMDEPAPVNGCDAVVHLAGENIAQRWTDEAKQRIRESRVVGTRNLVAGIAAAEPSPRALVSASGVDYYGSRGDEVLTEESSAGRDFLAEVCVAWEREAEAARAHGARVTTVRTAVVLDKDGGALAKMLPFFRLGIGGPVAGGKQYLPWIHADDIVGLYLAALDNDAWNGPVNAAAPDPPTNAEFSKALGKALHRPAFAPVPAFAIRLLYGDMAHLVLASRRTIPQRATERGYTFHHTELVPALSDALK